MTTYASIHRIKNIKARKNTVEKRDSPHGESYEVLELEFKDEKGNIVMEINVFGDYNTVINIEGSL